MKITREHLRKIIKEEIQAVEKASLEKKIKRKVTRTVLDNVKDPKKLMRMVKTGRVMLGRVGDTSIEAHTDIPDDVKNAIIKGGKIDPEFDLKFSTKISGAKVDLKLKDVMKTIKGGPANVRTKITWQI